MIDLKKLAGQWTQIGNDIYYNSGLVGIGNTAPAQELDVTGEVIIQSGNQSLLIGADDGATTVTNNTQKTAILTLPHILAAEEDVLLLRTFSAAAGNLNAMYYGGSSASYNSVVNHIWHTAVNNNTVTGTEHMRLDGAGKLTVQKSVGLNEIGGDNDCYVKGNSDNNLTYWDAGNDRVGMATNTPACKLHIIGDELRVAGTTTANVLISVRADTTGDIPSVDLYQGGTCYWKARINTTQELELYDNANTRASVTLTATKVELNTTTKLQAGTQVLLKGQTIAMATTITPNADSGTAITVGQLTATMNINAMTNQKAESYGWFLFTCNTTDHPINWNANFYIPGGAASTTVTASTRLKVYWSSDGTNVDLGPFLYNLS